MFWVNSIYRVWQWRWCQRPSSDGMSSAPAPSGLNSWLHRVLKVTWGHHGITANPRAVVPPPLPLTQRWRHRQTSRTQDSFTEAKQAVSMATAASGQACAFLQRCAGRMRGCLFVHFKDTCCRVNSTSSSSVRRSGSCLSLASFCFLAGGENDEFLFAGRNYFHISSFIYTLISTNVLTDKIFRVSESGFFATEPDKC